MTVGNPEGRSNGQIDMDRALSILNGLEEAVSGKPAIWARGRNNLATSSAALAIAIISSLWMTIGKHGSLTDELEAKHLLFLLAYAATSFLLVDLLGRAVLREVPERSRGGDRKRRRGDHK